ncbi:2-octaprenyl-6-methoxyphenol hydroxylase [Candidatus Erwinia haradaeae]|uniref:2-octaprenyl-6-methoxyphenol hydroxylase n=1 Tax=Candidatus Erwinia haradaeae TaxID=1922217 RepID=A0A451DDR3_9GAMM|nr:2-octaprenyl-6-methoxyphenyl hydroxylase [Candidatus Erwinia haradaeae]VFP84569.1 2-octaprenyl-6-methoxyphenol hydroxylase [Candidatus Erwinia haradaeae]
MSIIIAGGGLVGTTLALAISHATKGKKTVFLIEETEPKKPVPTTYDGRVIALSADTCQKIASFDLWSAIKPSATAITHIHISDRGSLGFISLDSKEYNVSALGHVIELSQVMNNLFSCLQKAPGVYLYCPHKVSEIKRSEQHVCVTLDNGEKIYGELLVAADGWRSEVAKMCGIKRQSVNYKQIAIVSTVSTQVSHNGWAFERFTDQGPLAMLPISSGYSALVWCQSDVGRHKIAQWNDKQFITELQSAFGWRLGRFLHAEKRQIYPLQLQSATHNISHRLVLIGDAAQTLHPVAAQGFNLGMRDIISLVETLQTAWQQGKGAGDYSTLRYYQQSRKRDVRATIKITDELLRLFSNTHKGLTIGRSFGLIMIDQSPLLRYLLAQWTLGWIQWNTLFRDKTHETL